MIPYHTLACFRDQLRIVESLLQSPTTHPHSLHRSASPPSRNILRPSRLSPDSRLARAAVFAGAEQVRSSDYPKQAEGALERRREEQCSSRRGGSEVQTEDRRCRSRSRLSRLTSSKTDGGGSAGWDEDAVWCVSHSFPSFSSAAHPRLPAQLLLLSPLVAVVFFAVHLFSIYTSALREEHFRFSVPCMLLSTQKSRRTIRWRRTGDALYPQ